MTQNNPPVKAGLAGTSWTLLGMMSYEEEVSGYDLKKWIDWSVGLYYWSPSPSQIYTELKKLEKLGLVVSRIVHDGDGARSRRLYRITKAGLEHVTKWINDSSVDPPVLKHSTLLRITFGHLSNPARLKELLRAHIAYVDSMQARAAEDARGAEELPAWAYSVAALRWAAKYYAAERQLALELIDEIDEAAAVLAKASDQEPDMVRPTPGLWRQIETKIQRGSHGLETRE